MRSSGTDEVGSLSREVIRQPGDARYPITPRNGRDPAGR
jgi:hypothetical protein